MKKYRGASGISEVRSESLFQAKSLKKIFQDSKEQILLDFPRLINDSKFIEILERQSLRLIKEIETQPVVAASKYFSRDFKSTKPIFKNKEASKVVKKYKVAGFKSKIKVKQIEINHPRQIKNYSLIVALSLSGSPKRIQKLTSSLFGTLKSSRPTLLISTINEINKNVSNKIIEVLVNNCRIPTVINVLPLRYIKDANPIYRRTLSQNVNLKCVKQYYCLPQAYLSIIDDDILFPFKNSFERLIKFLEENQQLRATGLNPVPYPVSFLKKIKYRYHPIYYQGLTLLRKVLADMPEFYPELHGSGILLRVKDHPEQIPHKIIFHDGWLSNIFTTRNNRRSARCPGVVIYHHEVTSLPRRLYKIKQRDRDLKKSPQERWSPYLANIVRKNFIATYQYLYQNWPKRSAALAMLVGAVKI